ncbi:MAG: hypothetical protein ABI333_00120 [bacterium]
MVGDRVLYFDGDVAATRVAKRALVASGCDVTTVARAAELSAEDLSGYAVVVLAVDGAEGGATALMDLIDGAAELFPKTRLLLQVRESSELCVEWMSRKPHLCHVQAKWGASLDSAELVATTAKLLRRDLFGLEKYLPWGAARHRLIVSDSRDKARYVREVSALATRLGCSERIVELVEVVVDELSTNAIFNAPRDDAGKPRHAHRNRREAVVLQEHERAELTYAFDGTYFAVALRDPFGALSRETVVSYLHRCLKQTPDQLPGAGGAGMGLFRTYRALSKLVINIRPGALTEVIGLIDLRLSIKQFKQQPKSLHLFVEEPEA